MEFVPNPNEHARPRRRIGRAGTGTGDECGIEFGQFRFFDTSSPKKSLLKATAPAHRHQKRIDGERRTSLTEQLRVLNMSPWYAPGCLHIPPPPSPSLLHLLPARAQTALENRASEITKTNRKKRFAWASKNLQRSLSLSVALRRAESRNRAVLERGAMVVALGPRCIRNL